MRKLSEEVVQANSNPDIAICGLASVSEPRLRGGYAEGLGDRSWKMKRGKLSKRPTTRWDELMVVR